MFSIRGNLSEAPEQLDSGYLLLDLKHSTCAQHHCPHLRFLLETVFWLSVTSWYLGCLGPYCWLDSSAFMRSGVSMECLSIWLSFFWVLSQSSSQMLSTKRRKHHNGGEKSILRAWNSISDSLPSSRFSPEHQPLILVGVN